ncbi:MAG: acyltransferase family protein [Ramlibacter sp.]
MAAAPDRVLGWDILRGLCAVAVAVYHLMYWQGLPALHTFGTYGVYMFFVLSGASLAYTYAGRLHSVRGVAAFLATRWLRLAPLYVAVCFAFLVFLFFRTGAWPDSIGERLLMNASFAFGFRDPAIWALGIGGWSLGIEFAYYLAFPLVLVLLPRRALCTLAATAVAALQWWWIYRTAGSAQGFEANAMAYHQLPAFAAYFFGGCVIGYWRGRRAHFLPMHWAVAAWTAMAVLMLVLNTAEAGAQLLGIRGAILFAACFAIVFASGHAQVSSRLAPFAKWLGDITYGCYLLHPMFFFGFLWFVWPHVSPGAIEDISLPAKCGLLSVVLTLSCIAAAASEHWFEVPLRRWGKRMLGGRTQRAGFAPYIDATSISS